MAASTQYGAFVEKMNKTAKSHPRSYVAVDGSTMKVITTGKDIGAVSSKVRQQAKDGDVTVILKMIPKKKINLVF